MGNIRNAIVGLGRIGSLLEDDKLREKPCTHAGAVDLNSDCLLAAGCDLNKKKRELFKNRWKCTSVYENIGRMLQETSPDILHIATPPETHLEIVKTAVKHNVPLSICEKPLAHNLREAEQIAGIHSSGKMTILTNHERRYSRDYIRTKSIIEKKTFGDLLSINSKLYMEPEAKLKSTLLHDGTHLVDIVNYLLSSKLEKKSVFGSLETKTGTAFIFCRLKSLPVTIEIGTGRDHLLFELDLSFSSGRIRIGNGLYEEYASDKSPYYENINSLRKTNISGFNSTGYFSNMLIDAVKCFKNRARVPVSSAIDGYEAISFILSAI
ncbi:MAG TPA: Gfo/Idh/MocA family oxidoreductase [Spirochaetes bacterium]|nr:Gfo/Idh/MocA family oxidoreductase [Spirochaetota bacterium]